MNKDGISIDELRSLLAEYSVVPLWRKRPAMRTPVEALKKFKSISEQCFILESLEDNQRWGRWTFLGFDPKLELSCIDGVVRIREAVGGGGGNTLWNTSSFFANPIDEIEALIAQNKSPSAQKLCANNTSDNIEDFPPFTGGLVGYFSFDFVKYSEERLEASFKEAEGGAHFKDCDLMLFDKLVVWDNLKSECYFFVNIKKEDASEGGGALTLEKYNRALAEIERIAEILENGKDAALPPLRIHGDFKSALDKESFCKIVEKAKRYIFEGDIFQVVLSNQLEAEVEGSIFGAYLELRISNPSPYMFYFCSDNIEISGASPETLVKTLSRGAERTVWTYPLAGTRRRGVDEAEDAALEAELKADEKELAEHNMLVDLGRNDLGKICEFGSVKIEKYLSVVRFSHVMHLGSTVRGTLRKDKSALDAIEAVLPAGTLSGAPKIRAIEIINELESLPRGIYGGAIAYIGFSGDMDACISIRIAYKKDGKVYVRSGAGIVADSISENEFDECRNKAAAVLAALKKAAQNDVQPVQG